MLQGTGSDVGKSLIVAGLARAYSRRGLARPALQAAEHVQQRRGHGRRRRDRSRPGTAGPGLRRASGDGHESGVVEAAVRNRRAGGGAGADVRHRQGPRLSGPEATAAAAVSWRASADSPAAAISCWWKAPAARRKSTCAQATSPTWASPMQPTCLLSSLPTSIEAA